MIISKTNFTKFYKIRIFIFSILFSLLLTTYASASNRYINYRLEKGDTLSRILNYVEIDNNDIYNVSSKIDDVYKIRSIKIGSNIKVIYKKTPTGKSNRLLQLIIEKNDLENVVASRIANDSFKAKIKKVPTEKRLIKASGKIDSSLFAAADRLDVPYSVTKDLVKKLSYDIDFQRDLRKDSDFEILYEEVVNEDGEVVDTGDIIFSSIKIGGDKLKIYRFKTSSGEYQYFSGSGESIEKSLLRTPVDGARLTSGFGRRKHPVLGYNKMHKGIDFGARTGTPVYAAGSGKIVKIQRFSSYGNYIKIKHANGYSTAYAHLNGFKKGLRKGSRVKQGQVIGYVGSTGRSTGPHLHYELLKNGKQINPFSVKTIATTKLKGEKLSRFNKFSKKIDNIIVRNKNKRKTQIVLAQY